jgi:galactokinase
MNVFPGGLGDHVFHGMPRNTHGSTMGGFEAAFGRPPEVAAQAPGRVNLLGEHTDYNDGYVLPIAIEQQTSVSMRRNNQDEYVLHSEILGSKVRFKLDALPPEHFATYVYGCLMEARAAGIAAPALDIHIESNVPMGVGLSSSAALEVATLRALRALTGQSLDDVRLAQLAQRAEIEYAGVRCGIMDQMASSLAGTQCALFLDTRTLDRRLVPLPPASAVLVLDSGVARTLAGSGYNRRRVECEEAARRLGVAALRDVSDISIADILPEPLRRRVRHVVSENARVLLAASCHDATEFGILMNASHASLRDDYEVSVPELDQLVVLLQAHPHVYGARLTGAGFGGACVALCEPQALREISETVLRDYSSAGFTGRVLVPPTEEAWLDR